MEHSLPVPVLYDDIRILWAASGTGSTPTHVVNYGGPFGEQIVWAEHDLAFDSKYVFFYQENFMAVILMWEFITRLRQYIPYSTLESITESYARPANCAHSLSSSSSFVSQI